MTFSSRENKDVRPVSAQVSAPTSGLSRYVPRYLLFVTILSAAAQCSSDTHSRAKAATASVVGTPRITRLTSPAGARGQRPADRPPLLIERSARQNLVDQPDALGFGGVDDPPGARQQQRLAVADQSRPAARRRPTRA